MIDPVATDNFCFQGTPCPDTPSSNEMEGFLGDDVPGQLLSPTSTNASTFWGSPASNLHYGLKASIDEQVTDQSCGNLDWGQSFQPDAVNQHYYADGTWYVGGADGPAGNEYACNEVCATNSGHQQELACATDQCSTSTGFSGGHLGFRTDTVRPDSSSQMYMENAYLFSLTRSGQTLDTVLVPFSDIILAPTMHNMPLTHCAPSAQCAPSGPCAPLAQCTTWVSEDDLQQNQQGQKSLVADADYFRAVRVCPSELSDRLHVRSASLLRSRPDLSEVAHHLRLAAEQFSSISAIDPYFLQERANRAAQALGYVDIAVKISSTVLLPPELNKERVDAQDAFINICQDCALNHEAFAGRPITLEILSITMSAALGVDIASNQGLASRFHLVSATGPVKNLEVLSPATVWTTADASTSCSSKKVPMMSTESCAGREKDLNNSMDGNDQEDDYDIPVQAFNTRTTFASEYMNPICEQAEPGPFESSPMRSQGRILEAFANISSGNLHPQVTDLILGEVARMLVEVLRQPPLDMNAVYNILSELNKVEQIQGMVLGFSHSHQGRRMKEGARISIVQAVTEAIEKCDHLKIVTMGLKILVHVEVLPELLILASSDPVLLETVLSELFQTLDPVRGPLLQRWSAPRKRDDERKAANRKVLMKVAKQTLTDKLAKEAVPQISYLLSWAGQRDIDELEPRVEMERRMFLIGIVFGSNFVAKILSKSIDQVAEDYVLVSLQSILELWHLKLVSTTLLVDEVLSRVCEPSWPVKSVLCDCERLTILSTIFDDKMVALDKASVGVLVEQMFAIVEKWLQREGGNAAVCRGAQGLRRLITATHRSLKTSWIKRCKAIAEDVFYNKALAEKTLQEVDKLSGICQQIQIPSKPNRN